MEIIQYPILLAFCAYRLSCILGIWALIILYKPLKDKYLPKIGEKIFVPILALSTSIDFSEAIELLMLFAMIETPLIDFPSMNNI